MKRIKWGNDHYDLISVHDYADGITYATVGYEGGDYRYHEREASMFDGEWIEVPTSA